MAWTYSVEWAEDSSVVWADRWERYYANSDAQIHWFAIVNSIMIVLFLTGMVAMIMMRTLHADLRQYSQRIESGAEDVEETGWKLVHGDVFRPPRNPALFSVLVGFGSQIFVSVIVLLFFAVLGFMSPAYRGGLLTAMLVLIFLAGIFSGYNSTKLYKMFKVNTPVASLILPHTPAPHSRHSQQSTGDTLEEKHTDDGIPGARDDLCDFHLPELLHLG